LVIEAPKVALGKVITNDIVKLHSKTEFEWLGRIDNVINSGGIKFFPEQIEEKLRGKIEQQFFIASEPDSNLGERLILVLEGNTTSIDQNIFEEFDPFEIPKEIYNVPKFKMTQTGKIQRSKTLELLK
jgi:O-succinylbenzoic acid--CoA ligase